MMQHKWLSPLTLSLLALGVSQVQAAIQSPVWNAAFASVDATHIAYDLIDLAPDDGIAPEITFMPSTPVGLVEGYASGLNAWYVGQNNAEATAPIEQSNRLLPSNDFTIQSSDGNTFFASTSDSLRAGAGFSVEDIETQRLTFAPLNVQLLTASTGIHAGGLSDGLPFITESRVDPEGSGLLIPRYRPNDLYQIGSDGTIGGNRQFFSLTPMTKVVFSMQADAAVDISTSMLSAYTEQPNFLMQATVTVGLSVVRAVEPSSVPLSWAAEEDAISYMKFNAASIGGGVNSDVGPTSMSYSELLGVSFVNDTPDAMMGIFSMGGSGEATMQTSGSAAIPEPSTYALMALGLLGVAGAARRRKA